MSETVSVQRDDFTKLLGAMKLIENCCTDCDIVDGKIRQKTNDRHSIIEIDVSDILGSNELCLSLIKQKVSLLRAFELDDNVTVDDENIAIELNDEGYTFIDPLSKMTFRKPLKKFLDNSYISEDEFSSMITLSEENLVLNYEISAYMSKRIKNICEGFNNEIVQCELNGLAAELKIYTVNRENSATVSNEISLNREMPTKNFKMTYLPFAMDINSDITLSAYQTNAEVLLCKFEQKFYGVPVVLFTQVRLCDD